MQFSTKHLVALLTISSVALAALIYVGVIGPSEDELNERTISILSHSPNLNSPRTSLESFADQLQNQFGLRVEIFDLDGSLPINPFRFSGVRLKNSIRLVLKNCDATYMVQNGILVFMTFDEADRDLRDGTNPGDLVAPICSRRRRQ